MASEGRIVLSYENTSLRESDVALLDPPNWVNDNVISFWFDYLENKLYKDYRHLVSFVCPQVVQCFKCSDPDDVRMMIESLELRKKQYIFLPINDSMSQTSPGGSHWSILFYKAASRSFEHFDSLCGGGNTVHARNIAQILASFMIGNDSEEDCGYRYFEMECPQQINSYDCGIHVICNTDALCRTYLKHERRPLADIASISAISKARDKLKNLINALSREKTV